MYKQRVVAACLVIFFIGAIDALALPAAADSPAALKASFQSKYNAMHAAFVRKNVGAFLSYYADDIVFIGTDGNVKLQGKPLYRKKIQQFFASQRPSNVPQHPPDKVTDITRDIGGMIVTIEIGKTKDRDFWVNRGGHWQIKRHREEPM